MPEDQREWKMVARETVTHEYDDDGRFLGVRTTIRNADGSCGYESFASAEDLKRQGDGPADHSDVSIEQRLPANAAENQRAVFAALLDFVGEIVGIYAGELKEPWGEGDRARWLARYDEAGIVGFWRQEQPPHASTSTRSSGSRVLPPAG